MIKWFVKNIVKPEWVSFEYKDAPEGENELGLRIFGVIVALYKGDVIYPTKPKNIRKPEKREFGESLYPVEK
jgi:hypothetical protein